jgi:hypothetical protein
VTAAGAVVPARPLAAQAHALRAAAAFIEHAGVPGLHLTFYQDRITIQVPSSLAGPDTRTAVVTLLAAVAGGQPSASPGWITADGDLAGHPVHVFTPIGEAP